MDIGANLASAPVRGSVGFPPCPFESIRWWAPGSIFSRLIALFVRNSRRGSSRFWLCDTICRDNGLLCAPEIGLPFSQSPINKGLGRSHAGIAQLVEQLICNRKMGFFRLWLSYAVHSYSASYAISTLAEVDRILPHFAPGGYNEGYNGGHRSGRLEGPCTTPLDPVKGRKV